MARAPNKLTWFVIFVLICYSIHKDESTPFFPRALYWSNHFIGIQMTMQRLLASIEHQLLAFTPTTWIYTPFNQTEYTHSHASTKDRFVQTQNRFHSESWAISNQAVNVHVNCIQRKCEIACSWSRYIHKYMCLSPIYCYCVQVSHQRQKECIVDGVNSFFRSFSVWFCKQSRFIFMLWNKKDT